MVGLLTAATTCAVVDAVPQRKGYVYRVLVSINQLTNTLLGGHPDETLSSRWGRAKKRGNKAARAACRVLAITDPCHCETAIEFDDQGRPLPHQTQPAAPEVTQ